MEEEEYKQDEKGSYMKNKRTLTLLQPLAAGASQLILLRQNRPGPSHSSLGCTAPTPCIGSEGIS